MSSQTVNLHESIRKTIKKHSAEITELQASLENVEEAVDKEQLKKRDELVSVVEGLNVLLDDLEGKDKEIQINTEYNMISTDDEKTFLIVHFDPKDLTITYLTSHPSKESALTDLKNIIEQRNENVSEAIK